MALNGFLGASLLLSSQLQAQALRDPTLSPVEAGVTNVTPGEKSSGAGSGSISIIVRDGHPFLMVGTRLYAQGQALGQARIERISETEIWLREDGVLRKVPQFRGIVRHPATPTNAVPNCAASEPHEAKPAKKARTPKASSSSPSSPPVAPCAEVQP